MTIFDRLRAFWLGTNLIPKPTPAAFEVLAPATIPPVDLSPLSPPEPERPGFPRYGDPLVYKGQCYFYRRAKLHKRQKGKQAGRVTYSMVWETICPDCGTHFEVETFGAKAKPRRRCDNCKHAGIPVVMKGVGE